MRLNVSKYREAHVARGLSNGQRRSVVLRSVSLLNQ